MRKFLRFADGEVVELTPISYAEFMCIDQWGGGSDMAYAQWLRDNGYKDPEDYTEETLRGAQFFVSLEPIPAEKFMFKHYAEAVAVPYNPGHLTTSSLGSLYLKRIGQ